MTNSLRPVDLGRDAGISAQTIRKYERWGFIPPSERGENGYRYYGPRHLQALRTARAMIPAFTWKASLRIMRHIHGGDLVQALMLVDGRFAELHRERTHLLDTLGALRLSTALGQAPRPAAPATARKSPPGRRTLLYVGEVAERAGVEVSAVRFWEQEGLLEPQRDPESGYRLFDEEQALRVQVVALLRRAGYQVNDIRPVVAELAAGRPAQAVAAAEERLRALAEASRRHVAAAAALEEYLQEIGL